MSESPVLPSSLMLLNTAHEYLGRRSWCCNSDGALLRFYVSAAGACLAFPCSGAHCAALRYCARRCDYSELPENLNLVSCTPGARGRFGPGLELRLDLDSLVVTEAVTCRAQGQAFSSNFRSKYCITTFYWVPFAKHHSSYQVVAQSIAVAFIPSVNI